MRRAARWGGPATLVTLLTTSCSTSFGMPRGASTQGQDIFDLWRIFFVAAIPVAGIVYGLILWSVIRYRRRRSDPREVLGAQFKLNTKLEIVYTAIPVLIVIGLFVASVVTGDRVGAVAPNPSVTVHVEAFQWGWRFEYAGSGVTIVSQPSGEFVKGPELVLPLGRTVRIVLTSDDVIHAFWVPGFLYKHDAIPGRTFTFDIDPTTRGTYYGECAEFCGLNHAYMTFSVRVVSPVQFASWVSQQQRIQGVAA